MLVFNNKRRFHKNIKTLTFQWQIFILIRVEYFKVEYFRPCLYQIISDNLVQVGWIAYDTPTE